MLGERVSLAKMFEPARYVTGYGLTSPDTRRGGKRSRRGTTSGTSSQQSCQYFCLKKNEEGKQTRERVDTLELTFYTLEMFRTDFPVGIW